MECERGDALPFFKQEPDDVIGSFHYQHGDRPAMQQKHHHAQAFSHEPEAAETSTSDDFVPPLPQLKPGVPYHQSAGMHAVGYLGKEGNVSMPMLQMAPTHYSQADRGGVGNVISLDCGSGDGPADLSMPPRTTSQSQLRLPQVDDVRQASTSMLPLDESTVGNNNAELVSGSGRIDTSMDNGSLNTTTLTADGSSQSKDNDQHSASETIANCVAIPIEELPPLEQISLKSDIFVNGEEGQFINDAGRDSVEKNLRVGNGHQTERTIENEKIEQIPPKPPVEPSPSDDEPKGGRKLRKKTVKVADRRESVRTRASSGSLPNKVCRKKSKSEHQPFHGIGIKLFNCSICKATFIKRLLLKKHMAEVHEGKPSPIVLPEKVPNDTVIIACPLCESTFTRKYGLKRHFSRKHPNVKVIPCPECNYTTYKLQYYLKHVDKHTVQTKQREGACIDDDHDVDDKVAAMIQPEVSQLKCRECHQIFKTNEALRLHLLNHKITWSMTQTQNLVSSNCVPNEVPNGVSKREIDGPDLVSIDTLPDELRSVAEQSVDDMSRLTCRLELLTRSLASPGCQDLLTTINWIGNLSTELTNLATTLGHILFTECRDKKEDDEVEDRNLEIANDDDDGDIFSEPESFDDEDMDEPSIEEEEEKMENFINFKVQESPKEEAIEEEEGKTHELPLPKAKEEDPSKAEKSEQPSAKAKKSDQPPKVKKSNQKLKAKKSEESVKPRGRRPKRGRPRTRWNQKKASRKSDTSESFDCEDCGKVFKDAVGLKRHQVVHVEGRPFKCKVCKMGFRRKEHLRRHSVKHTDVRPFKCDLCNYAAKTAKTLRAHSAIHGDRQGFSCKVCAYVGRSNTELQKHERKHSPCPLCGYMAVDNADFAMHKRSHLSYSCTECDYACYTSWQLRRHLKTHFPPGEDAERFCCEMCGYSCIDKRRFTYHMARHENKTPFSCDECDYKCSSRTSLDAHKLMHAGLRPFLCSICGASFRRTSHLNNHMLIHKEEKKHVCRTCGRPFRARHNLRMHEMIHTGEKQHRCVLCSFACRRNKELRIHMAKHSHMDLKVAASLAAKQLLPQVQPPPPPLPEPQPLSLSLPQQQEDGSIATH